ncbi:N-acetylated-alpha-linked acidic dipeptidase 2-like isoform X2 [Mya arenaria]|nr:N-acetylated-alpha-linked acidic dipeptidase 2-like isoform X2 [Mya arenaria]
MEDSLNRSDKVFFNRKTNARRRIIILLACSVATFIIGILIGRYAACPDPPLPEERAGPYLPNVPATLMRDEDVSVIKELMDALKVDNIKENLRMLANLPHLAGQKENEDLGRKLKTMWEEAGLDHVTLTPYHVLLSYPDMNDLNYVELRNATNSTVYKSPLREPVLTPEENKTGVVPPFNAYSAPGDIWGKMVYVNYARLEDFEYLEKNTNISVEGKIVFARYGKIYRGDKVHMAEQRKAAGVILFSDPADVTNGDITDVYPDDWWMPPSGTQRGTLYIGDGDPLSPDYPALSTAYRKKMDPGSYIPAIPCHPISYSIAKELMSEMGGDEVPPDWKGGMNVSYSFGDGYKKENWSAHIHVTTKNKNATTYNTVGIIRGEFEPDRYVILGNHRDAWVFGALDPSSGTAIMMEIVRVLGALVKSGRWRPRRSIMFCSWGAEEYGLIGSTEWVEHYTKTLGARAVAYLNVDIAVEGNSTFWAHGTPMLTEAVLRATKKVPNPNSTEIAAGRKTVYDTWFHATPANGTNIPEIELPGSGSDHSPFRDRLGVPIIDFGFKRLGFSTYPMYHSMYETFYLVDKIMDRGFQYHLACGRVWLEMARHLADTLVIPFNVTRYSDKLEELTKTFVDTYKTQLEEKDIQTSLLETAVSNFTAATNEFQSKLPNANLENPFVVRQINDQLMQLDRAFLDPAGLPGRHLKRHILFAESIIDNYSGSSFPGLSDALTQISQGVNVTEQWDIVSQHYSVILFTIQSATSTLRDVTDFMVEYY